MDLKTLQELVALGESENLEFKKSPALLPGAGETLCAFLNSKGGKVLIGVYTNEFKSWFLAASDSHEI